MDQACIRGERKWLAIVLCDSGLDEALHWIAVMIAATLAMKAAYRNAADQEIETSLPSPHSWDPGREFRGLA